MSDTKTPEEIQKRIELLQKSVQDLKTSKAHETLTKQKLNFFLAGYCLGKFNDDIVFQLAYAFGRSDDILKDLEELIVILENKT